MFKKIHEELQRDLKKLRKKVHYLEKKQKVYTDILKHNRGVFNLLKQNKGTRVVDILTRYHKQGKYTNKLAYLAGLVDGEGYLKIEKHGTIRLNICMTDKNTIRWIYNNFGGNFCEMKQKTVTGKTVYSWYLNQGKELFYLLILLLPFLVTKKKTLKDGLTKLVDKFSKLKHTLYPHCNTEIKGD